MNHADKGDNFTVDQTLDEAKPGDFDALMIPGGLMNPDTLRLRRRRSSSCAISFARANRSPPFATPPGS